MRCAESSSRSTASGSTARPGRSRAPDLARLHLLEGPLAAGDAAPSRPARDTVAPRSGRRSCTRSSWDDALDALAERVCAATERARPVDGRCLPRHALGLRLQRPRRRRALPARRSARTSCTARSRSTRRTRRSCRTSMVGSPYVFPVPDWDHSELLMFVGQNPVVSHGHVAARPDAVASLRGMQRARRPRRGRRSAASPRPRGAPTCTCGRGRGPTPRCSRTWCGPCWPPMPTPTTWPRAPTRIRWSGCAQPSSPSTRRPTSARTGGCRQAELARLRELVLSTPAGCRASPAPACRWGPRPTRPSGCAGR